MRKIYCGKISKKRPCFSISYAEGLKPIVERLRAQGQQLTGGTYNAITSWGVSAVEVESITSYPSYFGGRQNLAPQSVWAFRKRGKH